MANQELFGKSEKSEWILVTGATGFLGKYVVKLLLEKGKAVRALGRNARIGLELMAMGADFRPVDLRDRDGMIAACRGVAKIVHAGALSSAWGKYEDFYGINVAGTENVIAACKANGVKRLVYVSSPSVMSRHEEQLDLDETHPLPETFVSMYSETKALGEKVVHQAQQDGLETVILRPKALYGPGDQSTFPRIIDALSTGKLPLFGDGVTYTNITHVTDVAEACLLALTKKKAVGNTYLITGGEQVNLWDIIRRIADELGYPPPTKKISQAKAMTIGKVMEEAFKLLPTGKEPPLTRYKASVMCFSQTYNIDAARRDLGYKPKVMWKEGVRDFLDRVKRGETGDGLAPAGSFFPPAAADTAKVKMTVMQAGSTHARERLFGFSASWREKAFPALFALIEHPTFGPVVFDTGYSTRFAEATRDFPDKIYSWFTPVDIAPEQNAGAQVAKRGVDPKAVEWVILTHFDPDHIGGLKDFPNARIVCSWRAWNDIAGRSGLDALRRRVLTGLLPRDLAGRILALPDPDGPAIGPFAHSLDLFGDGTIRLVDLPGHATGMIGAFVRTGQRREVFLCADACWSRKRVTEADPIEGAHRLIAVDKPAQDRTYRQLAELAKTHPEITIVPSHCPDAAAEIVSSE